MSSSQSVAGQPLEAALSSPMHHGVVPLSAMRWESAISSSQLFGTW